MEKKKNGAFMGPSQFQNSENNSGNDEAEESFELTETEQTSGKKSKKIKVFAALAVLAAGVCIALLAGEKKPPDTKPASAPVVTAEPTYTENGFYVNSAYAVSALRAYLETGSGDEEISAMLTNLSAYGDTAEKADLSAVRQSQCFGRKFLVFAMNYSQKEPATVSAVFTLSGNGKTEKTEEVKLPLGKSGVLWVNLDELTNNPLPAGSYSLVLRLNGLMAKTVNFSVTEE